MGTQLRKRGSVFFQAKEQGFSDKKLPLLSSPAALSQPRLFPTDYAGFPLLRRPRKTRKLKIYKEKTKSRFRPKQAVIDFLNTQCARKHRAKSLFFKPSGASQQLAPSHWTSPFSGTFLALFAPQPFSALWLHPLLQPLKHVKTAFCLCVLPVI
ncbi:hypothetical protein ACFIQF_05580 [Comamonas sp. J-3]|jgi:hypothetical protein|uniref:hypothetical protein n=1 Tax=Comamonas trifloxystrobinivorans TaxID=3350256 RepID=UPI003729143F